MILASDNIAIDVSPSDGIITYLTVNDVKAMARLWLMREEIFDAMDAEIHSSTYVPLFDKIKALEAD